MDHFADRLLAACRRKGAPICVGLDPVLERLPEAVRQGASPTDAHAAAAALLEFSRGVLQAVAGSVPAVKPQSACFERYLWPGVQALHQVIAEARAMGLIVILDAKRGDIGISAEHYAAGQLADTAYADLAKPPGPDAITVSGYLGPDTLKPFIDVARAQGKGIFTLVRTSNPQSDAIQNHPLADGRTVA
ncbi:MAG: orotidine-5'-phosphate decarboxylase, partial [Phycisphaeraceae bacterium]|nr:orotidine-5'-phosphate decarboxylase [Phycisphaeraceae bacterium]